MCGIVGSVSTRNIVPILVQGLQRLEYRGYDSCGVAVYADGLKRARSTARVAELMEHNVITCTPDDTVQQVMAEMTRRRVRHLPVVEGGVLAGIVSIGDVVKSRLGEAEEEAAMLRDTHLPSR